MGFGDRIKSAPSGIIPVWNRETCSAIAGDSGTPCSLEKMTYLPETGKVMYRSHVHKSLKRNFQLLPGAQWLELLCRHVPDRFEHKGFIIHTLLRH